jgi:hypothetical protein
MTVSFFEKKNVFPSFIKAESLKQASSMSEIDFWAITTLFNCTEWQSTLTKYISHSFSSNTRLTVSYFGTKI